ncbi:NFX1-type zinc finger-containing protein 1 [Lasiodiplodia hormozganensis]|uniref:NFX1-type zinc finger-containing protein 1 n=1 Tax=Lasiodiplodia hormozganensis TaxID=869390 RepID=A0AA40BVT7_9PEZI|nr:NFX1-type zinc finger-containing protein 1 [Lasiodiplodia hormozganensis]
MSYSQNPDSTMSSPQTLDDSMSETAHDTHQIHQTTEPRHDNDHSDIALIDLMPTTDELHSEHPEYLPTTDPSTWNKQGFQGLVDRQFRLFREDTVGILRESIRRYLHISKTTKHHSSAQSNAYHNVRLDPELSFDLHGGLVFSMRVPQPLETQSLDPTERYEWWINREGLQHDALVCLWSKDMDMMFAQVGHYKDKNLHKHDYGADVARLYCRPFEQSPRYVDWLLTNAKVDKERNYTLLEFPSLRTWSFVPPLRALQQMSDMPDTPLSTVLEPSDLPQPIWIHPAPYAMANNFKFQLGKTASVDGEGELAVSDLFDTKIQASSRLDAGQMSALLHALRNRIALIQGPPGTGKSYTAVAIIETLLKSLSNSTPGPIVCVSYSNRALDSLLEKLHDAGVENMVRVGGQSKSDTLKDINLDVLVKSQHPLPEDKRCVHRAAENFFTSSEGIKGFLEELSRADRDSERRRLSAQIKSKLGQWTEAQKEYTAAMDLHPLNILKRATIVGVTASGMALRRKLFQKLNAKVIVFEEAGTMPEALALTSITPSMEHCILIGDHLQLRPKVNRWELEGNTNPDAVKFGFGISLLERLISFGLPFAVLDTQYRMHPDISQLSKSTLYPMLGDAGAVHYLPAVASLSDRVFWLDHQYPETKTEKLTKVNMFEVEMILGLTKHLMSQDGVWAGDILVLTPYAAQARALQERIQEHYPVQVIYGKDNKNQQESTAVEPDRIRIATVDSIQGDEGNIVLLSMVRSNDQGKAGFVKSENRSIVALSRARRAMYIFGNMKMLQTVPFWNQVFSTLDETSSIGTALEIDCPQHPGNPFHVKEPADFGKYSPNGGYCAPALATGTERFIINTRSQYIKLGQEALQELRKLQASALAVPDDLTRRLSKHATIVSDAAGKRAHISAISTLAGRGGRYKNIRRILADLSAVFQRVRGEGQLQSAWDSQQNLTHPRPQLQERLLLLLMSARLELAAMSDFLTIRSRSGTSEKLELDFTECRTRCQQIFEAARVRSLPGLAIEADILWAQWLVLERRAPIANAADAERLCLEAMFRLERAQKTLDPDTFGAFMGGNHCMGLQIEVWNAERPLTEEVARWSTDTGIRSDGFVAGVMEMTEMAKNANLRMCAAGHYFMKTTETGVCSGCGRQVWEPLTAQETGEEEGESMMGEHFEDEGMEGVKYSDA